MISVVIPTLNRAFILEKSLPSFYEQEGVTQVVIVDDGGTDNTQMVLKSFEKLYPKVTTTYVRHNERRGAAAARNSGVLATTNPFVLMGDDDGVLSKNAVSILHSKLISQPNLAGVSGRVVDMLKGEDFEESRIRFGKGPLKQRPFFKQALIYSANAYLAEDTVLPMTHAILLTTRELLLKYPFDERFCKGNGFREETTFQAAAFADGYEFLVTNDVHFYHFSRDLVNRGGQRTKSRFIHYSWCYYYNCLFLKRFYKSYQSKLNLKLPRWAAEIYFLIFTLFADYIRPFASTWIKRPISKLLKLNNQ